MTELSYLTAFLGGLLALLSPCSALLLPSFFAYAFSSPLHLLARTGVFYVGLASVLVPLGVGSSFASQLLYGNRDLLVSIAGWTIIAMGVLTLTGRSISWRPLNRAMGHVSARFTGGRGWVSTLLLGAVYGLAGFCSGPILGAVLTVSAFGGDAVRGGALLATYALGMAAPMFLLAWGWDRFHLGQRRWLRGRPLRLGRFEVHSTSLVAAILLFAVGVIFLRYDGTAALGGVAGVDTLSADDAAQRWVLDVGGSVPDGLVAGIAVLLVVVVAAGAAVRGRRKRTVGDPAPAPVKTPAESSRAGGG